MELRLQRLLTRLAELKRGAAITRHELGKLTGIDSIRLTKILSVPQSKLSQDEMEQLVKALFLEFRPVINESVTDDQLRNQLQFELFEFEQLRSHNPAQSCPFESSGKYRLKDISS